MTNIRLRLPLLLLSALLLQAAPDAQEQVTVVRRGGERVTGRFEDWNHQNDMVYVRVSQPDQRTIPLRDILVLEVGGNAGNLPANEVEAARGGDHVLVTRRGELLRGRLVNIEGGEGSAKPNEPRSITFQAGGERRFPFAEIARLYMGNYPQPSAAPAPAPAPPPGAVRVPGNQQWTATNITIRQGDRVQFSVEGEIQLSSDGTDKATAAGSLKGRRAPNSPAPDLLAGALIGRIGGGQPFAIGNQTDPLPMPGAGPLWLGINDDEVGDNAGQLTVNIRVIRGR